MNGVHTLKKGSRAPLGRVVLTLAFVAALCLIPAAVASAGYYLAPGEATGGPAVGVPYNPHLVPGSGVEGTATGTADVASTPVVHSHGGPGKIGTAQVHANDGTLAVVATLIVIAALMVAVTISALRRARRESSQAAPSVRLPYGQETHRTAA